MKRTIQTAIENGVKFLADDQEKDGSFMCLTSEVFDDYANAKTVPAIVPANIVLSSVTHLEDNILAQEIAYKTAQFLLSQRSDYWSFNYWYKGTEEFTEIPYPDDLDDTFCALTALYEYDYRLFDGNAMGKIVTMLTAAEDREGGPYNMWLVPKSKNSDWHDIDLVVNANIGFFLHLSDISLPGLNDFIEKSIDETDYEFPYNTIYPGVYFVSRFYKGEKVSKIIELLRANKEQNGAWQNPLRTALAASALLNLSDGALFSELENSIQYLLDTQNTDGSWNSYAFFFQMKLTEKTLYAGSASTTTALCIEALNKFELAKKKYSDSTSDSDEYKKTFIALSPRKQQICAAIETEAEKRFSKLDADLKNISLKNLTKTIDGDTKKEIILLADLFRDTLGVEGKDISDDFIVQLGLANVYGWIAYTIYDDFLDADGNPNLLSVANVALRETYKIFITLLPDNKEFTAHVDEIFDTIDGANTWESMHCRISDLETFLSSERIQTPDYENCSQLAKKSLGHALGPIAILYKLGYTKDSDEMKNLLDFFEHYLIARQLNDDAHDWQKDLENGQISAVVAKLLIDAKNGPYTIGSLEQIFWNTTIDTICEKIMHHVELAKTNLEKISIIEDKNIILKVLTPITCAVEKTRESKTETKKFLNTYTSRSSRVSILYQIENNNNSQGV